MITFKRILCPTDLSPESDEALRYGVALASAYNAKLFLLYCKEGSDSKAGSAQIASVFTASLAPHLGLTNFSELNWEGVVVEQVDDVGEAIVHEATKHNIDLIVMRSRRRPVAAALFGSTAETVFRKAFCPVLVVHPSEREWVGLSSGQIDLQRVLVAHDLSSESELSLKYGISLAQEYQAELHLLHVVSREERGEPELAWANSRNETDYKNAARQLQAAIPKEVFLWCKVVTSVSYGEPYEKILAYAKGHDIDLICLGTGGSGSLIGELFGSNVDRVLRQAPCPVLIARPFMTAAVHEVIQPADMNIPLQGREQQ